MKNVMLEKILDTMFYFSIIARFVRFVKSGGIEQDFASPVRLHQMGEGTNLIKVSKDRIFPTK